MSTLPDWALQRLALVRSLHRHATEQSRAPHPLDSFALLSLQDCVELFLHTAIEYHPVQPTKGEVTFARYFELLGPFVPGGALPGAVAMKRMNKARNDLKHHAIIPAHQQLGEFTQRVADFLEENSPLLFGGLSFSEVSETMLVRSPRVREYLQAADQLAAEGNLRDAMVEVATAFASLRTAAARWGGYEPSAWGLSFHRIDDAGTRSAIEDLARRLHRVEQHLYLVGLGLNRQRLAIYSQLAPTVTFSMNGTRHVQLQTGRAPTPERYAFCRGFVVDAALEIESRDRDELAQLLAPATGDAPAYQPGRRASSGAGEGNGESASNEQ